MTKHEEALKKLKPGDRVRVMRKVPDGDEGWSGCWLAAMDDAVGQVYTVKEDGYCLTFEERQYSWPAHACMPERSISGYFQKGDRVRVREVSEDSRYGWGQVWDCKHMHVGHVGVIADVTANRSLGVNIDGFWYPEWVLDHAPGSAEAPIELKPFEPAATNLARNRDPDREVQTFKAGDDGLYDYQQAFIAILASTQNTPRSIRSTTSKESTMSSLKIETHTFVNGVKVQDLSQDTIVDIITGAERELAKMKSVNTQTRALKAKIAKLEGEIARLVELSDERYAKDNPGETAAAAE